jgi:hypothetical protein
MLLIAAQRLLLLLLRCCVPEEGIDVAPDFPFEAWASSRSDIKPLPLGELCRTRLPPSEGRHVGTKGRR